jgi:hypothetical protein
MGISFKSYFVAMFVVVQAVPAFAAPPQLYNKTIQMSWSSAISQTSETGEKHYSSVAINHTVYVSSAGRLFERASRTAGKHGKGTENEPGATSNKGGEAIGLHFEGNRLVGNNAFTQGALRYVATFDSSFSGCTLSVTYGRDSRGGLKRRGINGVMYTFDSITTSGESCSIREGNPFS